MKKVLLSFLLVLTACGGVGTERVSDDEKTDPDGINVSADQSCSEDVKLMIEGVGELCAANMNVDVDRNFCLVKAKELNRKHPDFVCTLEDGQLIDSDYIQENFISKIETQADSKIFAN